MDKEPTIYTEIIAGVFTVCVVVLMASVTIKLANILLGGVF